MNHNQILDDFSEKPLFPVVSSRFRWYCIHAALVISLLLIVLLVFLLLPYLLPTLINETFLLALIFIVVFGMAGITIYVCYKGCKWPLFGAFIGGSFMFICCFVFMMNHLTMLRVACKERFELWFNSSLEQSGDALELMLLGIGYSILIIPFCEIIVLITDVIKRILKDYQIKKRVE